MGQVLRLGCMNTLTTIGCDRREFRVQWREFRVQFDTGDCVIAQLLRTSSFGCYTVGAHITPSGAHIEVVRARADHVFSTETLTREGLLSLHRRLCRKR